MKTIVVLVLIASGISSSVSEISDEAFMKRLNDVLEFFFYLDLKIAITQHLLYPSFDRQCILDKYKEKNMTERIPSDRSEADGVMFWSVAFTCSSKLDILLETAFDMLMSHHPLIKAFFADPAYDKYLQLLICANSHAVDSNILDSSVYDFKHEVSPQNQDECNDLIDRKNEWISEMRAEIRKQSKRPCSIRIATSMKQILVKNVLLVQVDLTDQQKNQEKSSLVKQTRQVLQDILTCSLQNPRPN
jgi:hypothetical protein